MTDSHAGDDDALGRKLAEALSLAEKLLQARQKDEQELVEQVAKISSAKGAAAVKASDRLRSRLDERASERGQAEQIQSVLAEVSELSGGVLQRTSTVEAEAKAEREIAQKERDEARETVETLRAEAQSAESMFAEEWGKWEKEKADWAKERAALTETTAGFEVERAQWNEERQTFAAEQQIAKDAMRELEAALEESATEAARAMGEMRDEFEKKSGADLDELKLQNEDLNRRVDDLQLLVKVKTEMMEKFETVLEQRDASIQSLIADVEEKGEAMAHLSENLKALRADYIAKEKAAASHESKATASTTVVETLKAQLSKVSEDYQTLQGVLISRSKTIDELQALVKVLSGDTDVDFAVDDDDDPVSLPGGFDGAMPAPVDVGALPDAPNTASSEGHSDDGEPDVVIEEDYPHQTGEIAKAAALAAAKANSGDGSIANALAEATIADNSATSAADKAPAAPAGIVDVDEDSSGHVNVGGWADAVDSDDDIGANDAAPQADERRLADANADAAQKRDGVGTVEDSVADAFFGVDINENLAAGKRSPAPVPSAVETSFDLDDIEIHEDIVPLKDDDVVQKTPALDDYECDGAEEVKLAGILSHQPWRVEEITKLTKLDGAFVREKLAEFARNKLIEIIDG